jgi:hypothetical protein
MNRSRITDVSVIQGVWTEPGRAGISPDEIQRYAAQRDSVVFGRRLSGNVGNMILTGFAKDSTGVIDLRGGLGGFTTPQAVVAALQSDHHGGTLLSLGHGNSLDFDGVARSQLHAANFAIG